MGTLYQRGSVWWIKYYQGGRPMRESTGTTKETVARRILRQREGDIENGIPITPKMGKITFEEAATDLLNDYQTNERDTYDCVKRRIDLHLAPFFRGRRMVSIGTPLIREYITRRREEGAKNATIVRELAALKRMFTLSVQANLLNKKPHFPMPKENNVRQGFFEREAFEAVRAKLSAPLQPVMTFAYLTGWRVPSEVLTRQWKHVDRKVQTIRLEPLEAKNDDGRIFPYGILPELAAIVETQWQEHERLRREGTICSFVFHRSRKPIRCFYGAWKTACKAAGCPGRIPHDFRRTAVRNLVRAGVSDKTAMQLTAQDAVGV